MYKDLGLQVLDNLINTRWKVLPREQCQGQSLLEKYRNMQEELNWNRHSQLCREFHYPKFELRRDVQEPAHTSKQAESSACVDSETGVAS